MAWDTHSLKNSLYSILGVESVRVDARKVQSLEQLRAAMLASLGEVADGQPPSILQIRLAHAKDIQTLWYLRADLMGVLASRDGETAARAQLDRVTLLFKGLLPKGLMSRSSPLRG